MAKVLFSKQKEMSPSVEVKMDRKIKPVYGRHLEDFAPGEIFVHPRGFTFLQSNMVSFARTYMQMNPIYLNVEYARAHGFAGIPASPQMVFNVVLSLGVQNDSEKAMANLGYYNAEFLEPVYHGDTIRSMTKVIDRKDRGEGKPGIVTIRTLGINQHSKVVLQYERKIMVGPKKNRKDLQEKSLSTGPFPWIDDASIHLPDFPMRFPVHLTGNGTYYEDFEEGDIIIHANGRTITDEHIAQTYMVGNTHPLHYDRIYSTGLSGAMSGEPIVYGGLVFAWLEGLASRDISENAVWELGFTEGYHTQPAVAGDTVEAISRVLSKENAPVALENKVGVITFQLIGIKNRKAVDALEAYGAELFAKENTKKKRGKEKIKDKIFEIERRLLIKKHAE